MKTLIQSVKNLHSKGRKALVHLSQSLEEIGGCDHSVGICVCDMTRDVADFEAALTELETHHPQLTDPSPARAEKA